MVEPGDGGGLFLRMAAPQHEHARVGLCRDGGDHGVGDGFPAFALMRGGLAVLHRQRGVEQQHALPCPMAQVAVGGAGQAQIGFEFLVDIDQTGRHFHPRLDRERQAMRLPRAVIGVLTQNHDFHRIQRGQLQRGQPRACRGVNGLAAGFLRPQERAQRLRFGCGQHRGQRGLPAGGNRIIAGHRHRFLIPGLSLGARSA